MTSIWNKCARCGRRKTGSRPSSALCGECRADTIGATGADCEHCGFPLVRRYDADGPHCVYTLCPPYVRQVRIIQWAGAAALVALALSALAAWARFW